MIVQIIGIIAITTVIVCYFNFELQRKEVKKTYNANIQGWLLIRGDHICDRIEKYKKCVRLHNNAISDKDFMKFVADIEGVIHENLCYRTMQQNLEDEKRREEKYGDTLRIYR